ncbi:purine-nucleoside phosphorylase [Acetivibrio thermocellus]|uniref:purine-nucleoside phosphorylase n=1 Tax=Acetivibrio thermocellus TaxID=1515 RepID=UPI0021AE0B9E|nr:purine-nucleoside phosphorylase [Acetivibrio thermocellus]UWV46328.1 purine-nucleoside phosphorylase [Acetivibrio thermocellus]
MSRVPTAHNAAVEGQIAKTVLMPGDPLRAKFIAETYLENVTCFNTVRNMLGFTGTYQGKPVSVMGHGMGIPSIGIYSYELFNFYDVDNIIRIGSAGALSDDLDLKDLVIAMGACTDSNYANQYQLPGTFAPIASYTLMQKAIEEAQKKGISVAIGNVLSTDVFYNANKGANGAWKSMGVLCIEMEAAALYMNAAQAGKNALCILSISDHIYKGTELSAQERQLGFKNMIEVALGII